jgi:hypothetical protein
MTQILGFALAYAGFVALALAMHRHHRRVWHRSVPGGARMLLRMTGVVCLCLAFAACVVHVGWSVGPVLWLGLLTASGLGLAVLLCYAPRVALGGALLLLPAGAVAVAEVLRW